MRSAPEVPSYLQPQNQRGGGRRVDVFLEPVPQTVAVGQIDVAGVLRKRRFRHACDGGDERVSGRRWAAATHRARRSNDRQRVQRRTARQRQAGEPQSFVQIESPSTKTHTHTHTPFVESPRKNSLRMQNDKDHEHYGRYCHRVGRRRKRAVGARAELALQLFWFSASHASLSSSMRCSASPVNTSHLV